jgi:hypothetical protein
MHTTDRLRRLAAPAAVTAAVLAITGAFAGACAAGPAQAAAALAGTSGPMATSKVIALNFSLRPMPQGRLTASAAGVHLTGYGFTPGSSHEVAGILLGTQVPLGTLKASAAGSVSWSDSLTAMEQVLAGHGLQPPAAGSSTPSVQLVILNAGTGTPVIAQTAPITGVGTDALHAVEPGWGVIKPGKGSITYNPGAHTLSVTIDATGLTPGAHAAHIHAGSCQRQGAIVYTLMDFTANSNGAIVHETRTVTGVNSVKFGGGWYFNLHQGNAASVTSNGQPTIDFRPLLCSNF